jgi:nicotinamidase-related amidase
MNVLVVIDVQNCFMFHKDGEGNGGTFLNAGQEASMDIVRELETLVDGKSHVVFSRDFHPVNHISLEGYERRKIDPDKGIWPKHCRNKRVQCGSRVGDSENTTNDEVKIPNKLVDTLTGNFIQSPGPDTLEVIGTELSYMFFTSEKFRKPVKQLIEDNRKGDSKIGLADTLVENENGDKIKTTTDDASRSVNYEKSPIDDGGIKYITLTKGERCEKEAYSAFNYHIVYDSSDPANPVKSNIKPDNAANSTGLWEWILKNRQTSNEITITVCGLVGNVCVMHSLLQGIALWNNVYSKIPENKDVKVKFVYSLKATRFTDTLPPEKVKPDSFDNKVVEWFNQPFNRPDGMGTIIVTDTDSGVQPSNNVTSFEVLNYDGEVTKIGTFAFAGSERDFVHDMYLASNTVGGTRRRRRSVRRRRGNKSRKITKRVKGRRTYKNKRRNTKRRL